MRKIVCGIALWLCRPFARCGGAFWWVSGSDCYGVPDSGVVATPGWSGEVGSGAFDLEATLWIASNNCLLLKGLRMMGVSGKSACTLLSSCQLDAATTMKGRSFAEYCS